jgi:hypothetical protein
MKQWDIAPGGRTEDLRPKTEELKTKQPNTPEKTEREDSFLEPIERTHVSHKPRADWWMYLMVAFLTIIFMLLVYIAVRGNRIAPVVVPAPQVTVTTPPAPAEPPSGSLPENTTPAPAPAPVNKADITVRVLNGSGKSGDAAKVRDILKEAGFTVTSIGNTTATYEKTNIYYKKDGISDAVQVQNALTDYQTELIEDENLVGSESKILVIVGKT